jgi:hypothetical protein
LKTTLTIGSIALCGAAILLGQLSAHAGGKGGRGDGGVAGGSTNCSTAPALLLGDNAFDTSSSTVNLAVSNAPCGSHTMYRVHYFTFTPTQTGTHTFQTCNGTSWDSRLAILSTCSGSSDVLACNDDACGLQSLVTASLNAGTTYRVVVGGFSSSSAGPGTLTAAFGSDGGGGGGGGGGTGEIGPDVIVGAIPDISKYGSVVVGGQTIMAYAIGTTSCNIGDELLSWFAAPDNRHPFITQNIYRIKNGRIQQIGLGWGKHGFTALQGTLCGSCIPSSGTWLGVGCSDQYSAGLNGSQSGLGTRTEVNATTGYFPGTYNVGMPGAAATIGRRIQVNANELNPSLNAGATYLVEGQYIHAGDAARGNDDNNASWRAVTVGTLSSGAYTLTPTGATVQQKPAIDAWRAADSAVSLVNADVPGDGRFILGYAVRANSNGTWRYEYAVQNLNSDRSGRTFEVPIPAGATVTNVGFSDVFYHSGDPYDGTDWSVTTTGGAVRWTGPTHASAPNGNALRFSTIYNFWFDADVPPMAGETTLGLFKPGAKGAANSIAIAAQVPTVVSVPGDLNGDGAVNAADLAALLGNWGGSGLGDIDGDGSVGASDLAALLSAWS